MVKVIRIQYAYLHPETVPFLHVSYGPLCGQALWLIVPSEIEAVRWGSVKALPWPVYRAWVEGGERKRWKRV